jgi:hypothetical protein
LFTVFQTKTGFEANGGKAEHQRDY